MKEIIDNSVFDLCQKIIENGKLTENEVYNLSELINKTITACDNDSINWPTNLLIKPLQKVWINEALDQEELNIIAELLISIVYNSKLNEIRKTSVTKTCPHCGRVLMSSIIPRCSWCGGKLEEKEMYTHSEDWLKNKKIDDAWEEVLSEKQISCFSNWFGRLYECPVDKWKKRSRWGDDWVYDWTD